MLRNPWTTKPKRLYLRNSKVGFVTTKQLNFWIQNFDNILTEKPCVYTRLYYLLFVDMWTILTWHNVSHNNNLSAT